jgi:hypothetical protein
LYPTAEWWVSTVADTIHFGEHGGMRHIGLIVATVLCGCTAPGSGTQEERAQGGLPATPLFSGVANLNYAEGERLIQERLQRQFPKGSSARQLSDYLGQQGLRIERDRRNPVHDAGVASVRFGWSICGSQVRVSWAANAANELQSVDVLYSDTGCP